MTEKQRFKVIETITHDDKKIYELTKNDIGYYNFKGEKLLAHMICNELNKLLEENEQLKQDIENLKITIDARETLIDVCEKKFKELGYIITVDDDGYVIE